VAIPIALSCASVTFVRMCGIAGVFSTRDYRSQMTRVSSAMAHRGPDDSGVAVLGDRRTHPHGVFVHRRLSIIDLTSAGHQPMTACAGRYSITYNGEIYNFPELRDQLEAEGAVFHSNCDTEAILLGWALHGSKFLGRLRGMFAFGLWDRELSKGYLARDAFGIKPLYVAAKPDAFVFASEVRALVESGLVERRLSAAGLASFLNTGSVAEPYTIVEGVMAVRPGTLLEICFNGDSPEAAPEKQFAGIFPTDEEEVDNLSQSAFQLRNALRDSVAHHLLSDVPIATFLSGGLDSSAIVGIASEVSERPLETFTVTFSEQEYSEGELGRKVAERFSTRHHEVPLSGSDLLDALPAAFGAMDQPSLDGLNTFIVSRAVRSFGIKVALSGLGGDELFAGYPSFRRAARLAPLWSLPASVRKLSAVTAFGLRGVRGEKIRMLMGSSAPAEGAYVASRMLFGDSGVHRLLQAHVHAAAPESYMPRLNGHSQPSLLRDVSMRELAGYMRNTLLRDSDVFSMAHSLELRVPFLDPAVVRVAARAADSSKLNGGSSKPLLVKAVGDLLPAELMSRPKRGFTLPFDRWMRTDLHHAVDATFSSDDASRVGLSKSEAQRVWQSFKLNRGGVTWSRPWALYTLIRWATENRFLSVDSAKRNARRRPQ